MRRIRILGIAIATAVLLAAAPASADPALVYNNLDTQVGATFYAGPQQVHVSIGESAGGTAGDDFWVNVRVCDYLAGDGPRCWDSTGNIDVERYNISPAGAHIEVDVELRCVFSGCTEPYRWVHLSADWRVTDGEFEHFADANPDPTYGTFVYTSREWSDYTPDVAVSIDAMPIDMPLPPLQQASFWMSKASSVQPQP